MTEYPAVLSEMATLTFAVHGRSLARYGDGELRLALGGRAISQDPDEGLAAELRQLLAGPTKSLVCIPNVNSGTPKMNKTWYKYVHPKFIELYKQPLYGSSFITRPDSAPWIDCEEYWTLARSLWWDREVTFVVDEEQSSLGSPVYHARARNPRVIYGPRRDAYAHIDRLEAEIGCPSHTVLICLGATATVLAERLARKGVHALDLGHIGKLMPKDWR